MAYVADFTTKSNAAKALTLAWATADLPEHVADDYLVLAITCEAEVAVTITATAGWTQIGATVGNPATATGLYSAMFYKKCAGAAESCTLTLSVTNASHGHAFLIKDADTTTFLDGTPSAANVATASQFTSASITTATADTLLLFYVGVDSTTTTPTACHTAPDGKSVFLDSSDNAGANVTAGSKVMASGAASWYFQRTAGVTPTPAWNMSLTGMTNRFTVGIKNKTGGMIPAYPDDTAAMGTKLLDGHRWVSATALNNEAWKATPLTVTSIITHLGTLTGTFSAGTQVADTHINPYSNSVGLVPATSATALTGSELGFTSAAINMTTGWIVGSLMMSGPKLANFNHGTIKQGGTFLSIGSTTNYRIFQIMARDNLVNTEGRAVFSVQANQTQTQSGQSTTAPTITAIDKLCILNRGNTAALALYAADFHLITKIVAAGGDANYPVGSEELWTIGKCVRVKMIQRLGASGLMPMVPIQIGGGDAINFQIDAGALQFPRIYSRTFREINYHGADNAIGISYAGKSGDVIKHTNSVVTSESPYYWEINSAATNAATWDFTGLVIVKANVTLRNVMTFSGMAFSNCPSLVFSSCTVTDCKIAGVPAASASLTATSATISYCAINVSTVTAGNHFVTLTDPSIFSNCSFTGGGGHAIRITTAGTYTFTGNTFTGFGADASTGAAIINDSGGVVTLNIAGGGGTPTYKNGTGTSTVINNAATVTFTGLVAGSDVTVTTSDTNTVVGSVDQNGTTSWGYTYSGTPTVDVLIMKAGYVPYKIYDLVLTTSSTSLPISQAIDRAYQ